MSKLDSALQQEAAGHPEETFRVIVRVEGDVPDPQQELEKCGFSITRQLRLIRGFGASAAGATLLKAADETWIVSIEPDGQVYAMTSSSG